MTVAAMALVIGMTSAAAEQATTQQTATAPDKQPLKAIAKKAGKVAKTISVLSAVLGTWKAQGLSQAQQNQSLNGLCRRTHNLKVNGLREPSPLYQ
jgi:hypothetical protein